jgi:UTP-glucose-1-phosphate uridylyltransferase
MLKKLFLKKILDKQLAGMPEDQKEKIIDAFSNNPELFETIAKEIKAAMEEGKDQMTATQEVVARYQDQLRGLFS